MLRKLSLALLASAFLLHGAQPRVLVSSDIGGTDPDDQQSMAHLLLYADVLDIEGLISSPYGPGRLSHILEVIDAYAKDYPNLRTYSKRYPTPERLRSISKQGALDGAGLQGFASATQGSRWIIECARRPDPRPLYVLVWGGIDDLAQALHDAPDILPKLRVYFIGGPNKMWSVNAYDYIEQHHPGLWMIEANSTYRGWFVGGNQAGDWGNAAFVAQHVAGHGALGEYFARLLKGVIKMGDTPSVAYLLNGDPANPSSGGWGGKFVRLWDGRKTVFDRATSETDTVEAFGTAEFRLPLPEGFAPSEKVSVRFDNRVEVPASNHGRTLRFRFSPRDAKVWSYTIDGKQAGRFTAVMPPPARTAKPSSTHPHWWIDDPDPAAAEGIHWGARHVSRWREEFLEDFARRMQRCATPKSEKGK